MLQFGAEIWASASLSPEDPIQLFPHEPFAAAGLPSARIADVAEPIDGPSFAALSERARANRVNLVVGAFLKRAGAIENVSVLFGRGGELVGTYVKRHPTEGEIDGGVTLAT